MACVARVFNNNNQTVTADETALTLLGTTVVNNTDFITVDTGDFTVHRGGIYHLSADVTFTPSTTSSASTIEVYWSNNGTLLPCTLSTVATSGATTVHTETDIQLGVCCMIHPTLTLCIKGAAGTVSHISAAVDR